MKRHTSGWVAVLGLAALGACSPGGEVQFSFQGGDSTVTLDMLTIRFSDPLHSRTVTKADFTTPNLSRNFETMDRGNLHMDVVLARSPGDTVAHGALDLTLRSDWRYGVEISLADSNPTRFCFGCIGSRSFVVSPTLSVDSLFLVWGGNSISDPVIY
jgi:hypothetical protein